MTVFDFVVLGVVGLSTVVALLRGFVREIIALAAWVVALVAAFKLAHPLAALFTGVDWNAAVKQVIAFSVVFLVVLIAGGLMGVLLSRAVRAVGLGWIDRFLGAAFGFVRGVAVVLVAVLIAGLTSLPQSAWWQNAALARPLVVAALELRSWLPSAWADQLEYGRGAPTFHGPGTRVEWQGPVRQEMGQCAES